MIRKIYGIVGLMDYTTQIKAGKATVSVHFCGGALTAYGVTPAKFSTSNKFLQHVIEGSEQFQSGRIKLLDEMEVADDKQELARKAQQNKKKVSDSKQPADSEVKGDVNQQENDGDGAVADVNVVSVADKPDAIEYLKEHFPEKGFTATKLRTDTAFKAACQECRVQFTFNA